MTRELYTPKLASLRQKLKALEGGGKGSNKEHKALREEIARLEKTEIGPRLLALRIKLKASEGKKGYEKRVEKIHEEIAWLERLQKQEYDL